MESSGRGTDKVKTPNNFSFPGTPHFVGRERELNLLHEKLQTPGAVAISAVAGMGGVGKTELAIKYIKLHQDKYPGGVCWFNAREQNLAVEVVRFAQLYMNLQVPQQNFRGEQLSLTEQVAWCWQHWQPAQGLVLVILDDVTDLEFCRDLLPQTNRFRVVMTTRLHLHPDVEEIPLDVLPEDKALELLTLLVGEKVQREAETAKELCAWLGYLPLGLELVGRYLAKKPRWTLAKMLERLKVQSVEDEALKPELFKTLSTAQRGVKAAFELSWLELAPMTQRVGELLSLFALSVFAWEWVEAASNLLSWAAIDVETANEQLYERHLINIGDEIGEYWQIHPLIREFLGLKLREREQAQEVKTAFAAVFVEIAKTIPKSITQEVVKSVEKAIPHLARVADNIIDAVSDENLVWLFWGLGIFYEGKGFYTLAEPWRKQCVSVVKNRLGKEHPDVATSYNNLAMLYYSQGKYTEAEPLYLQALKLLQSLLGQKHRHVATSYNNLALLYQSQGKYKEAEPLLIKALEIRKHLLGLEHPDVATSYNNLAALYISQGKYKEAEPLLVKAFNLWKNLLGQEHPNVATSYNNLALLYKFQGKYKEAEPLLVKALNLWENLLGQEHPNVATGYNNLALLYNYQGKYEQAEPLLIQALNLWENLLGQEHPDVATSYNSLALLYFSQGKYTEAEELYIKALQMRERLLGQEHPDVATNYYNLARLYKSQGKYTEAEKLYIKALQMRERLLGQEHPDVATSYNDLAKLYYSQGKYTKTEELYIKALQMRECLLGQEHSDVASSYNNLASLYYSQGRYTEAEPLFVKALEIAERSLGVNHPNTIIIRDNLQLLREML
ncbi:MAG TPA: tetratricopeptide repeat protein [Nostocaceae cyanobacterium]|nr:tetratricopeptide repeat protein [Nostocaceae cyanobacterium]